MGNSYDSQKFTTAQKVLANLDKCSKNGDSNVVNSPWGVFKMYRTSSRLHKRFYSVSGSEVLHNGGSYKMSTFRTKFAALGL